MLLQHVLLPLVVGVTWGATNPLIRRGALLVERREHRAYKGAALLDAALQHVLTPQFIVPQLLNLLGSVLFAFTLSVSDLSLAAPLANGVSLAANAVGDHLLGDRLPPRGALGLLLVLTGVTLCTLSSSGA